MRKNIPHDKASSMWDHDIPTRCLFLNLTAPSDKNWGTREVIGYNKPLIGVARGPLSQGLLVIAGDDEVMAYDGNEWRTLVAAYDLDEEDEYDED